MMLLSFEEFKAIVEDYDVSGGMAGGGNVVPYQKEACHQSHGWCCVLPLIAASGHLAVTSILQGCIRGQGESV
jgi:hypothetical protein